MRFDYFTRPTVRFKPEGQETYVERRPVFIVGDTDSSDVALVIKPINFQDASPWSNSID